MSTTPAKKERTIYQPFSIESKWQAKWQKEKTYQPDLDTANSVRPPYYNLHMFPYPSAEGLHVGNVYAFTGADIYGRFKRMQGNSVFQPFGLDGFGIHSENYALKVGSHPVDQAEKSEKRFYAQVASLGSGYDWSHLLETYKPEYYKWTQWIFTELFKAGLAYRENVPVNFCPSCRTVLADEQVIDGKCERCSSVVEKRDLEQWMFRITEYAEQLLAGLSEIDWTEKVKIAQRNWIGKSEGAKIEFKIQNSELKISVFTTRPDTLNGATFMVVSPEHPLVQHWMENPGVRSYVETYVSKSEEEKREKDKEKTGVFSGVYALNPINNQQMPVWIADYVLMGYGTGAIMAVPAHDERDFAFAKKYDLPIVHVVAQETGTKLENEERRDGGCGVVFDPQSQKYAVATHPDGMLRLFAGGVEKEEDMQEGTLREIREESGLHDFSYVEKIRTTLSHYYNNRKDVNRLALASCYLVIVANTKEHPTHLEAHEAGFQLAWRTPQEILANWEGNNEQGGFDHWITYLKQSVGRAIELGYDKTNRVEDFHHTAYTGSGVLINSGDWDGLEVPKEIGKVISSLKEKGIGSKETNYHLRDWLISRQRYWGPPIPMIYCQSCAEKGKSWFSTPAAKNHTLLANTASQVSGVAGWYPEENLPVKLPYIDDYKPLINPTSSAGESSSPLGNHPEFYTVACPACGETARRETDVSDTFLDSSWYFLRYLTTDLQSLPFPMSEEAALAFNPPENDLKEAVKRTAWLPVTIYTGGAEHSVLHLLYTRFLYKVFVDLGLVEKEKGTEPFPRFYAHGLIIKDGSKMSKSKGNVVVPDEYVRKFGADTLRAYLMFLGPFNMGGDFRDSGIEGMSRFVKRVWTLITGQTIISTSHASTASSANSLQAKSAMNQVIKGVTQDMEEFRYNTAIAKIMTYYNLLAKQEELHREEVVTLLKLWAPFAPHMTEELWELIGEKDSIHLAAWPDYDESEINEGQTVIAVQINGKLRATLVLPDGSLSQAEVEKLAHAEDLVEKHLAGMTIRKVIYVPGKILNFVI